MADVSALGNLHYLDLSGSGVVDVSALGKLHYLDLRHCMRVSDTPALGGVQRLMLRPGIEPPPTQ